MDYHISNVDGMTNKSCEAFVCGRFPCIPAEKWFFVFDQFLTPLPVHEITPLRTKLEDLAYSKFFCNFESIYVLIAAKSYGIYYYIPKLEHCLRNAYAQYLWVLCHEYVKEPIHFESYRTWNRKLNDFHTYVREKDFKGRDKDTPIGHHYNQIKSLYLYERNLEILKFSTTNLCISVNNHILQGSHK